MAVTPLRASRKASHFEATFRPRSFASTLLTVILAFACIHANGQGLALERKMQGVDVCSLPSLPPGYVLHILRVRALSSGPTDGTYSDFGEGWGEFVTVQLLKVLVSPVHLQRAVFRVHPFPGAVDETGTTPPERMTIGKTYLIVFPYYLRHTPRKPQDLIGLTRCGVMEDTPENNQRLKVLRP